MRHRELGAAVGVSLVMMMTPVRCGHHSFRSVLFIGSSRRLCSGRRRLYMTQQERRRTAKIVSLSDGNDPANRALHDGPLPDGASLVAVGACLEDFDMPKLREEKPNVLFVSHPKAREPLAQLLQELPSLEWVHTRSAGIDFVMSPELSSSTGVRVTNAKGQFSSSLAEYALMACSYFAKNVPRLLRQQSDRDWNKFNVLELRGSTMGIVGYGDIGRACAKLAKVYGMRVHALRRHPRLSVGDPYCDVAYGIDSLHKILSESDYIVVSAPLTEETRGLIGRDAFRHVKQDAVFINLGRGPVVEEEALIHALQTNRLKGAALDVFATEPLPQTSQLWELDNALISPHNMDQTATFMHEATDFFIHDNLKRFLNGDELLNVVDKVAGY